MEINSKTTKAELLAYIEELKGQINAAKNVGDVAPVQKEEVIAQPTINVVAPTTDVTIVYCSESMGYVKLSNIELYFNHYGDEYTLSRSQFDELVGKYRRWFDRGVLAVSYRDCSVAAAKGLPTDKEFGLTSAKLESIGRMNASQLEQLWNENSKSSHRDSIVCFYKRKFIEGDPKYRVREKVDLLNRLTDGGFRREQDELDGRVKYNPTDFTNL